MSYQVVKKRMVSIRLTEDDFLAFQKIAEKMSQGAKGAEVTRSKAIVRACELGRDALLQEFGLGKGA